MDERRTQRVSEAMREELAELIAYEMSDPRVAGLSVVEAHVSPDLRHARIMLASGDAGLDPDAALLALDHARGFLRRELSSRIGLHRMPELHFELEPIQGSGRITRLLKRVRRGRPRDTAGAPDEKKPVA